MKTLEINKNRFILREFSKAVVEYQKLFSGENDVDRSPIQNSAFQ